MDQYAEAVEEQSAIRCECWDRIGPIGGFSSERDCQENYGLLSADQVSCVQDVFASDETSSTTYLECALPPLQEFGACLEQAAPCDTTSGADGLSECSAAWESARQGCVKLPADLEVGLAECEAYGEFWGPEPEPPPNPELPAEGGCYPVCVEDVDPSTPVLDVNCAVEFNSGGSGSVPQCDDGAVPPGADACYIVRVDRDGTTATTQDDLSSECWNQRNNLEFDFVVEDENEDPTFSLVCQHSTDPTADCPE